MPKYLGVVELRNQFSISMRVKSALEKCTDGQMRTVTVLTRSIPIEDIRKTLVKLAEQAGLGYNADDLISIKII